MPFGLGQLAKHMNQSSNGWPGTGVSCHYSEDTETTYSEQTRNNQLIAELRVEGRGAAQHAAASQCSLHYFFLDLNITDHLSHSFTHAISTHPSHLQHGPHLQSFQ